MSDIRQVLLTPVGVYIQDEDGQGWTLLTKDEEEAALIDEEEAALIDESLHHLTNEEAEQYFQHEMDVATLSNAIKALHDLIGECVRIVYDYITNLVPVVCQAIQAQYRVHPRPDYDARPKCCTRAKTKRDRKQRSRER